MAGKYNVTDDASDPLLDARREQFKLYTGTSEDLWWRNRREWFELWAPRVPRRRRKPGGGRKPLLSARERAQLREVLYCAVQQNAQLRKEAAAVECVRQQLSRSKRGLSDSTLLRHVVRPVLKSK